MSSNFLLVATASAIVTGAIVLMMGMNTPSTTGCGAYVTEDWAEVPDVLYSPVFSHVVDTGEEFSEGGYFFQEYIIDVVPEKIGGGVTLEEGYIFFYGEALTPHEVEERVSAIMCGHN